MGKYIYDNHEINEGMFVILGILDALQGKYGCNLPRQVEITLDYLIEQLTFYVVPRDKYNEVDFDDTRLICQYIYYKKDLSKYKRNKLLNILKNKKNVNRRE